MTKLMAVLAAVLLAVLSCSLVNAGEEKTDITGYGEIQFGMNTFDLLRLGFVEPSRGRGVPIWFKLDDEGEEICDLTDFKGYYVRTTTAAYVPRNKVVGVLIHFPGVTSPASRSVLFVSIRGALMDTYAPELFNEAISNYIEGQEGMCLMQDKDGDAILLIYIASKKLLTLSYFYRSMDVLTGEIREGSEEL